ncbi:hypothetical protein HOLleu_22846 [Holothuria leucospilota]|uniref:Protein quiver n=1 Tax=Holothuria leucospilota TaxID=206669 RepID=A0A9Q1BUA4_HOLLE|nr:hypothetical protein HOLleu_22846 [Holothuria leucospilota]
MSATGTFFLAICFALLLTGRALQCYFKFEYECSPSGPMCDKFGPPMPMDVMKCDSNVTMCSLITVGATAYNVYTFSSSAPDFKMQYALAECLPMEDDDNFTSGCYGRKELEKLDPLEAELVKRFERIDGTTLDPVEICICDGNLCNGSIKYVFSISIIVTSVVISLMLFY